MDYEVMGQTAACQTKTRHSTPLARHLPFQSPFRFPPLTLRGRGDKSDTRRVFGRLEDRTRRDLSHHFVSYLTTYILPLSFHFPTGGETRSDGKELGCWVTFPAVSCRLRILSSSLRLVHLTTRSSCLSDRTVRGRMTAGGEVKSETREGTVSEVIREPNKSSGDVTIILYFTHLSHL